MEHPLLFGSLLTRAIEQSRELRRRRPRPRVRLIKQKPRRAAEWRAYQAGWMAPIDQIECNPERFQHVRKDILHLDIAQAARLLRVAVATMIDWESGKHRIPFSAYLSLVLVSESLQYKMANEAWAHWELRCHYPSATMPKDQQGYVTYLRNKLTGYTFTPEQLDRFWIIAQAAEAFRSTNIALNERIEKMTSENQELREMLLASGVTDKLHEMKEQLDALVAKANTARILQMPKAAAVG